MKKLLFLIVVAGLVYGFNQWQGVPVLDSPSWIQSSDNALRAAYDNRQSNLQIQGKGVVSKILSDDFSGSRHQRFVVMLGSGQTLLIAHNIDLAPRLTHLNSGDAVEFYGEYECNPQGGVIHWTHHDPSRRHSAGWLKHRGKTYQ